MRLRTRAATVLVASVLLAGCGAGVDPGALDGQAPGDDGGPPDNQNPPQGDVRTPDLPATPFDYEAYVTDAPAHFKQDVPGIGNAAETDNTPQDNPVTNHGATLGRVLFYDVRLSANNTTACASCHKQRNGFGDTDRLSTGFNGGLTGRHSPGLTNAAYYEREAFFWDERAPTLEEQVLMPIQDPVEMGMALPDLVQKLAATDFYPQLFQSAFGSPEINSDRISRALAQFVRSMISYNSKYDRAFNQVGVPNFEAVFDRREMEGLRLFTSGLDELPGRTVFCDTCHGTPAHVSPDIFNTGLDAVTSDQGAGRGRLKAPSLRNVAVRGRFMHDGRFRSLREVLQFYNNGVQNNPDLEPRMIDAATGQPRRLNLSNREVDALVDFLETLTDDQFLRDPKFSDPFRN